MPRPPEVSSTSLFADPGDPSRGGLPLGPTVPEPMRVPEPLTAIPASEWHPPLAEPGEPLEPPVPAIEPLHLEPFEEQPGAVRGGRRVQFEPNSRGEIQTAVEHFAKGDVVDVGQRRVPINQRNSFLVITEGLNGGPGAELLLERGTHGYDYQLTADPDFAKLYNKLSEFESPRRKNQREPFNPIKIGEEWQPIKGNTKVRYGRVLAVVEASEILGGKRDTYRDKQHSTEELQELLEDQGYEPSRDESDPVPAFGQNPFEPVRDLIKEIKFPERKKRLKSIRWLAGRAIRTVASIPDAIREVHLDQIENNGGVLGSQEDWWIDQATSLRAGKEFDRGELTQQAISQHDRLSTDEIVEEIGLDSHHEPTEDDGFEEWARRNTGVMPLDRYLPPEEEVPTRERQLKGRRARRHAKEMKTRKELRRRIEADEAAALASFSRLPEGLEPLAEPETLAEYEERTRRRSEDDEFTWPKRPGASIYDEDKDEFTGPRMHSILPPAIAEPPEFDPLPYPTRHEADEARAAYEAARAAEELRALNEEIERQREADKTD